MLRSILRPLAALLATSALLSSTGSTLASPDSTEDVVPAYDDEGRLLLPQDWQRWVLAGSSLGLSYTEGEAGRELFHQTLIEPTAYDHFVETGEFREGTMLALVLHDLGEGATPSRRGTYADDLAAVEMAVKDSSRPRDEAWAYYNFAGTDGLVESARAFPARTCHACHAEHAAYDNVFMQFYSLLRSAAPDPSRFETAAEVAVGHPTAVDSLSGEPQAIDPEATLALGGLDPVQLIEGRSEMGKAEIIASHEGLLYRFLSEPSRAAFAADPERYSVQNEACLVVQGAPNDPAVFAVHEGRIYGFATPGCVASFLASPASYLD